MKKNTALLTFALIGFSSFSTIAEDSIAGSWLAKSVNSVEPPNGVALNLSFDQENKATIVYTLTGESQTWQYTYTINEGQLSLKPITSIGEPATVMYDIKFDEGKLLLLTPKPKPVEQEDEAAEEAAADEASDAEGPVAETDDAEAEIVEEVEEEDTRVPVWVLVKA